MGFWFKKWLRNKTKNINKGGDKKMSILKLLDMNKADKEIYVSFEISDMRKRVSPYKKNIVTLTYKKGKNNEDKFLYKLMVENLITANTVGNIQSLMPEIVSDLNKYIECNKSFFNIPDKKSDKPVTKSCLCGS